MFIRQRKTQAERDIQKFDKNYRITERDIELICEAWWNGASDKECAEMLALTPKKFSEIKDVFRRRYDKLRREWERDRLIIRGRENQLTKVERILRKPLMNEEMMEAIGIAGWTLSLLAEKLGVPYSVLQDVLNKKPSLRQSYENGKHFADVKVLGAILKRALGTKVKKVKFATHEGAITDSQEYYEEIPPDPTSAMNWAINRLGWVRNNEKQTEGDKGEILKAIEELSKPENGDEKDFEKFELERVNYD